ncbi:MAG: gamma-glutamylcyclotransferase family protein [Phycisphaeraceae bacterium]
MSYVFGYGSLMSPASANVTLQRPAPPSDLAPATLAGYHRVWNVLTRRRFVGDDAASAVVVLGIEPAPAVQMVGTLLALKDDEELARLDEREACYDRIDVTPCVRLAAGATVAGGVVGGVAGGVVGPVWTYLPRAECTVIPDGAVIAQAYLDAIAEGCRLQGEAFTRQYHDTTVTHRWRVRDGRTERVGDADPGAAVRSRW